jgi:PKD repeat protein
MRRMVLTYRTLRAGAACAALLVLAGCTVHKEETPALTGPSAMGTSIVVTVSPDTVPQDGASTSLVQISAFDNNGQPKRNSSMRVDIAVDGAITDFGRISARSVVTDANGRASVVYTAPPPVLGITSDVVVQILVTPSETDFGNATIRSVNIRVVPTGVLGPPTSPFQPDFVPPQATVGNPASFTANITGGSPNAAVVGLLWDFGDGTTDGGLTATHTYETQGTFLVTLAILDSLGRTNSVTHSVTVSQGQIPTAAFVTSPANPVIGQVINFNGSGSVAEPGHHVVTWAWNFGDGTLGSDALTTHVYPQAGTYTVTLKVTDDVGRKSALVAQTITVSTDEPIAAFTMTPNPGTGPAGSTVTVFFDAATSVPRGSRTIVSYAWTFSNGGGATGRTTSHGFLAPGTYQITLTVTDSAGKTGSVSQTLVVTGT